MKAGCTIACRGLIKATSSFEGKPMKCDSCHNALDAHQTHDHLGRKLCEDCYMEALSPTRTCDPWAVHAARSHAGEAALLNATQQEILAHLRRHGAMTPQALAQQLAIAVTDLAREFAVLRHLEKARATLRDGEKLLDLW
jgi:hypothetical protein